MRLFRIACNCPKKTDRRGRSTYLGALDTDSTGHAYHHCKVCNTTWEFRVDGAGTVYRSEVKTPLEHANDIAYIDLDKK